jgi:membrane fusion protein, multidrug efflux system
MKSAKPLVCFIMMSIAFLYTGCSGNSGDENQNNSAVKVEVEQAKTADGNSAIAYSGTIEESETIPLAFSVMGNVSRVLVSEGDFVKKGQLLAELNDESYKNMYEMSLATLKQAEDAYKRLEPMYKNGNLPEIKFIETETNVQKAKSSTAISKKNLEDCKLYATENGIVGKRSIEPGMTALSNMTSIKIVKIEKVFAKVSVPENEISSMKKGRKAKIKIGALNNTEYTGVVEEVGVLADPIAHTYQIKIGIANRSWEIKPGMICNVFIENFGSNSCVIVPNQAVSVDEKGRNYVYSVSAENKATRKYVTVGQLLNNGIEIRSGINAGENVVVSGQQKLIDNASVQIENK